MKKIPWLALLVLCICWVFTGCAQESDAAAPRSLVQLAQGGTVQAVQDEFCSDEKYTLSRAPWGKKPGDVEKALQIRLTLTEGEGSGNYMDSTAYFTLLGYSGTMHLQFQNDRLVFVQLCLDETPNHAEEKAFTTLYTYLEEAFGTPSRTTTVLCGTEKTNAVYAWEQGLTSISLSADPIALQDGVYRQITLSLSSGVLY